MGWRSSTSSARSRCPGSRRSNDLRARHRPADARQVVTSGSPRRCAAARLEAAADASAALVDEPGDDDRLSSKSKSPRSTCPLLAVDDRPGFSASPVWPTWRVGAPRDSSRCGRPEAHEARASRSRVIRRPETRSGCRADLPRSIDARYPGVLRHATQRFDPAPPPITTPIHVAIERIDRAEAPPPGAASRRANVGSSAADRRRRLERRPRVCWSWRSFPEANTLEVVACARQDAEEPGARSHRHIQVDSYSSSVHGTSRSRQTTCAPRCSSVSSF